MKLKVKAEGITYNRNTNREIRAAGEQKFPRAGMCPGRFCGGVIWGGHVPPLGKWEKQSTFRHLAIRPSRTPTLRFDPRAEHLQMLLQHGPSSRSTSTHKLRCLSVQSSNSRPFHSTKQSRVGLRLGSGFVSLVPELIQVKIPV